MDNAKYLEDYANWKPGFIKNYFNTQKQNNI